MDFWPQNREKMSPAGAKKKLFYSTVNGFLFAADKNNRINWSNKEKNKWEALFLLGHSSIFFCSGFDMEVDIFVPSNSTCFTNVWVCYKIWAAVKERQLEISAVQRRAKSAIHLHDGSQPEHFQVHRSPSGSFVVFFRRLTSQSPVKRPEIITSSHDGTLNPAPDTSLKRHQ